MSEKKGELSSAQLDIFSAIEKNDATQLRSLLAEKPNVNIFDENLMTPLQHAAYKGNREMVQTLLDYEADPNLCQHQHNYTALHFAGLSGSVDVCAALLLAGAKTGVTNTVNRTAAQMAAFVGHHNCVTTINNYISKADVDAYAAGGAPLLPAFLAGSLHRFLMQINVHPLRVALNAAHTAGMADHLPEVQRVLQAMSAREMGRGQENNEVMAFKFHYLATVLGELVRIRAKMREPKTDPVEVFARKILKPGPGGLEILDGFLRDCVKSFAFKECTLFRQMVTSLTVPEPPAALSVVSAAINGQRGFVDCVAVCSTCGEEKPPKKCAKCKKVQYCDRSCQVLHWAWHKKACAKLVEDSIEVEAGEKAKPDPNELASELQNLLVQH